MGRLGDGVQTRGAVISRSPSLPLHHRTKEAIAEGRLCVEQVMPMLKIYLNQIAKAARPLD
jgi:hypothetical protein